MMCGTYVLRKFKWLVAALFTPWGAGITGIIFFILIIFQKSFTIYIDATVESKRKEAETMKQKIAEEIGKAGRSIGCNGVDIESVRGETADAAEAAEGPGVIAGSGEIDRAAVGIRTDAREGPQIEVELVAGGRVDGEGAGRDKGVIACAGRARGIVKLPVVIAAPFPDE